MVDLCDHIILPAYSQSRKQDRLCSRTLPHALSRKVKAVEGTVFCSGETGFSLISADKKELCLYMINKEGKVLHTVRQTR